MKRNITILTLLLFALVVVAYVLLQQPGEISRSVDERELLVSVDSSRITRITISGSEEEIILVRKGSEWFLERPVPYQAEQAQVTSLIALLTRLQTKSVVSTNRDKHALFHVDTSGMRISVGDERGDGTVLIVGKSGTTDNETYVRRPDGDAVHLVDADLATRVKGTADEWRDRTIVLMPREQIRKIKYQYGDTTFTLLLADSVWRVGNDVVGDWVVNNLLYSLSNLRAEGFVDSPGISTPPVVGAVSYEGITLWFMRARGGKSYVVKSSTGPQLFRISEYQGEQILKRRKGLVQKP